MGVLKKEANAMPAAQGRLGVALQYSVIAASAKENTESAMSIIYDQQILTVHIS
jgi:hypothetical protein